jgi:hypothetical protein
MDTIPIRTDRNSALVPFFRSSPISKTSGTVDKEKEPGTIQSPMVQTDTMGKKPVPGLFNDPLGKQVDRDLVQFRPEFTHERYGDQLERSIEIVDAVVMQEAGITSTQSFKDRCTMDRVALDVRGYAINKYKLAQRTDVQPGSIVETYA